MTRREHLDDPLHLERAVESQRRAGIDLAWIVVLAIAVCVAAINWRVPDRLLESLESADRWNVNGLLTLLVVVPLGATLFATRRYRDAIGAQKELERLSLHDALTGLPNRRHLKELLPQVLQHARRNNGRAAVLFIDLDGFKAVNDTYGHEVGDLLMTSVGARLQREAGEQRFVARYAGDEFVLVDPLPDSKEGSLKLARSLVQVIEVPFELGEDRIAISASVGVAFGDSSDDPEAVLRDADTAMYDAKAKSDRSTLFDASMRTRLTPVNAEARLETALGNGEFRLHYQPLVTLREARLVGVEALLRWEHPEKGLLFPIDFLSSLEETGLIVPVGHWVIGEACRQARAWAEASTTGALPLRVSMNVSPRQLAQSDFVDIVRDAVTESGVDPRQMYLELTETALLTEERVAWATLKEVRELGVGLALDDFGTGYSSISHLRNFDLELVKLDRTYIAGLGDSPDDDVIVRHVVALSRDLGIATLAEGVTSQQQAQRLLGLGCELGQGSYFAEAQPRSVIDQLLERSAASASSQPAAPPDETDTVVLPSLRRRVVRSDA